MSRPRRPLWLLLAFPGVFFLFAFHLVSSVAGGWYAFTDWNGASAHARFIGLGNFRNVFNDPASRNSLFNTLKLAAAFVLLVNVIGLALALGLNRCVKTRFILRAVFFLPILMAPLAISYVWQYVFDFTGGLNRLLAAIGLHTWERPWLGDPHWAIWTVLVVLVWQFAGLSMVIYLAGLQGIPDELVEAAAIDGASHWRQLRRITLPLLAPAITVSATLTLIFGLRLFDQVLGVTGGGPVNASQTLATEIYFQTFTLGRFGYGAALALVLAGLTAVVAFAQMGILRARESRM